MGLREQVDPAWLFPADFLSFLKRHLDGVVCGCPRELAELVVAAVAVMDPRPLIWVVGENERVRERTRRLRAWLDLLGAPERPLAHHLRPFNDPFAQAEIHSSAIADKFALAAIADESVSRPVVISTLSGLAMQLEPASRLAAMVIHVHVDMRLSRETLIERLAHAGYVFCDDVTDSGQVARRGSILDVFPPGDDLPARLEFEGSRLVSLRRFDPETQKSVDQLQALTFPPLRYFCNLDGLAAYLQRREADMQPLDQWLSGARILTLDREALETEHEKLLDHFGRIREAVGVESGREGWLKRLRGELKGRAVLDVSPLESDGGMSPRIHLLRQSLVEMDREAIDSLRRRVDNGLDLTIASGIASVHRRLDFLGPRFSFLSRDLPAGVESPERRHMLLPYRPWVPQRSRELSRSPATRERFLRNIRVGELVTHRSHGIGRFLGVERLTVSGFDRIRPSSTTTEVIVVEYRDRERLYVPVYEADSLRPYTAMEGHAPELDRMGGRTWRAKQSRARRSIIPFARELLQLYAQRKATRGTAFAADSEWEGRLQRRFRFVETADQKRAIHDVLRDLEAAHPMDRLVCGDVSFGKTEVAVRAAFRVIINHGQVAMLCPTTILASQHFQTFSRRMEEMPVRVEMLSRLVPPARRRVIIQDVRNGKVDLVIGTHALLGRHLDFPRLGLLIIDEEQRFGVFQKEKLKQKHPHVDVLTLSATPIPRTLSFSMAGLQDISVIRTPPLGRLAIHNTVSLFRPEILISAVLNEVERGGQVYIVYNDIRGIEAFRANLAQWLPDVDVAVIHAQMRAELIEKTLLDFINRRSQVLLSTTIIENGIDIPAVNTLVVVKAERFGLTQLYQLRGRIGRGDRRAHAYFLVSDASLSEKAQARLQALKEFAELGAGYRLAEFDLRLRGAGSLLGNRQHGHIEALGFDYYMELLQRTIQDLKGGAADRAAAEINVRFAFAVEPDYIPDMEERVGVYRRVMAARDRGELGAVRSEVKDRFGRVPPGMDAVFRVAALRLLIQPMNVVSADVYPRKVVLTFAAAPEKMPEPLPVLGARALSPRQVEIPASDYADLMRAGSNQNAAGFNVALQTEPQV